MTCKGLSLISIVILYSPLNFLFLRSALPCIGPVAVQSATYLKKKNNNNNQNEYWSCLVCRIKFHNDSFPFTLLDNIENLEDPNQFQNNFN